SQAMDSVADSPSSLSSTDLEDIERATIQRVFEQVKGAKGLAGRMLGISRAKLYRKLKRYNIGTGMSATSQALQYLYEIGGDEFLPVAIRIFVGGRLLIHCLSVLRDSRHCCV